MPKPKTQKLPEDTRMRVLVVGAGSGIARSFTHVCGDEFRMKIIPGSDGSWQKTSFKGYDAVLTCAAWVHHKQTKLNRPLYDIINRELTLLIAQKAKDAGVPQFIFLSSMAVFGYIEGCIGESDTPDPPPRDAYACSKARAERELAELEDDSFGVTVLRPPMVYGRGCRGNFTRLWALTKKIPFFPDVNNTRGLLYSENLGLFIRDCIVRRRTGVYHPQNKELVSTGAMVRAIAEAIPTRCAVTKALNPFAWIAKCALTGQKLFGSLCYDPDFADTLPDFYDFKTSVQRCTMALSDHSEQ